jgi:predicted porin
MDKSILAFMVLLGNATIAYAQSSVTTYGLLDAGVVNEAGCKDCTVKVSSGAASVSRVGIRGSEKLGNNTSAVFTVESEVELDTGRTDQAARLFGGQAYVGLAGDFGALTLGRQYNLEYLALTNVGDPFRGGMAGSATNLVGYSGKRVDNSIQYYSAHVNGVSAGASYGLREDISDSWSNRAWGVTVGFERGPLTLRAAHQNRHVANIHLFDQAGTNMDAKNSILAANLKMGWGTAYAAYSASRGWGSSPLFNPDNPYGAGLTSTPSTDSRDVLMGVAVPMSRATTLLASYIHKNDRNLANRDANQLAVGATFVMSRRTDFYAAYSHIQNTNGAGYTVGNASARGSGSSAVNIGMRHAF